MPEQSSTSAQALQLGMVNPPRKAKRLRELVARDSDSVTESTTSAAALSQPVQGAPIIPAAAARPRGRKPAGPMSRAAREQLRKTNHSVIEKRRREKINEALAALRELVPNDTSDGEEKEFKLEVLVRTVEYLRMMVTKVKNLEEQTCTKCGKSLGVAPKPSAGVEETTGAATGKRKRTVHDDPLDISDDEDLYLPPTPLHAPASPGPKISPSPRSRPHLPSISTWLLSSPVETPAVAPHRSPSHPYQLPSPPQSAPIAPKASTDILPRLILPPGMRLPTSPAIFKRTDIGVSSLSDRDVPELPLEHGQASAHVNERRHEIGSPESPWTRDDQTAASLLLNISSRRAGATPRGARGVMMEAQTPSSVLGMREGQ